MSAGSEISSVAAEPKSANPTPPVSDTKTNGDVGKVDQHSVNGTHRGSPAPSTSSSSSGRSDTGSGRSVSSHSTPAAHSRDNSGGKGKSVSLAPVEKSDRTGDNAIKRIAEYIKSGKVKNVVVLNGAGISTSAGIPDFRSPSTGLYHNLQKLNLPFPEAVFEIRYFRDNPQPFWTLAQEIYPGKHLPTTAHYFINLLAQHKVLSRVWTQNIDTLEHLTGLESDQIVEAHGSFATARCLTCEKEASTEYVLKSGVRSGKIVKCGEEGCDGLVKPDIVFFGEGLPEKFFKCLPDLTLCDLLIVIGTSLSVHPFARLPSYVQAGVPRLLINREAVGPWESLSSKHTGPSFLSRLFADSAMDEGLRSDDYYFEGDADDGAKRLAEELGWNTELETTMSEGRDRLREEWAARESLTKEAAAEVNGWGDGEEEAERSAEKGADAAGAVITDETKVPLDEIAALQKLIERDLRVDR